MIRQSQRRLNTPDDIIYHQCIQSPYDYKNSSLIRPYKNSPIRKLNKIEYLKLFKENHPLAYEVLRDINDYTFIRQSGEKLYVAGEAAASPYIKDYSKSTVDFYIIHSNPPNPESDIIYVQYEHLINKIMMYFQKHSSPDNIRILFPGYELIETYQKIEPGLIYLQIGLNNELILKYRIILKSFISVYSLLSIFSVDSSCIAFNGRTALLNESCTYAQYYGINTIIPSNRTKDYEKDLIKYFNHGYSLYFPDYEFLEYDIREFSHMKIIINEISDGKAIGEAYILNPPAEQLVFNGDIYQQHANNILNLMNGNKDFNIIRHNKIFRSFVLNEEFQDILSRDELNKQIIYAINQTYDKNNHINPECLSKYFGLNQMEIDKFIDSIKSKTLNYDSMRSWIYQQLHHHISKIFINYEKNQHKIIEWFLTVENNKYYPFYKGSMSETIEQWYNSNHS